VLDLYFAAMFAPGIAATFINTEIHHFYQTDLPKLPTITLRFTLPQVCGVALAPLYAT
jgi:hypothetical protein